MNEEHEKKYYIDFGPEILSLLGPNLYTNIYYVLGEIIANSYDADANNVHILYNSNEKKIIVEDDGIGMSYEEINRDFLPVGMGARGQSYSDTAGGRKRMGRKGIGKLAALSVSERVKVMSIKDGKKAGCVLTLNISPESKNGKYEVPGIDEADIIFHRITTNHGSSIVMENSRYDINKTIASARRNISLIFPIIDDNFKIHIENLATEEKTSIDDLVIDIVKSADALLTFSDQNDKEDNYLKNLHTLFNNDRYYNELIKNSKGLDIELPEKKRLHSHKGAIKKDLILTSIDNKEKTYELRITGWIATFATIAGKTRDTEFSPTRISLTANKKLSQFDIQHAITTNRQDEAYVVGQFNIDLLDNRELPDIASSNRQGYKEDDLRYTTALSLIKEHALWPIINLKVDARSEKNFLQNEKKKQSMKQTKKDFEKAIDTIIQNPEIKRVFNESEETRKAFEESWALKDTLKDSYKKVLISHTSEDKTIADEIEKILHYCGFTEQEILYTSSDNLDSKIDAYENIFEYLREFFINSTIKNDISVIYILNKKFINKWDPVLEAGAGWILRTKCFPMFTDEFESVKEPIRDGTLIPKICFEEDSVNVDRLSGAMLKLSDYSGKRSRSREDITSYIKNNTKLFKIPKADSI